MLLRLHTKLFQCPWPDFTKACCLFFIACCVFLSGAEKSFARTYANNDSLFDVCMQRCTEPSRLGNFSRDGCFKGCAEARRISPLREKSYSSHEKCSNALIEIEENRDLFVEKGYAWCDKKWTHLHDRKGCKDAFDAYISAATPEFICNAEFANYPPLVRSSYSPYVTGPNTGTKPFLGQPTSPVRNYVLPSAVKSSPKIQKHSATPLAPPASPIYSAPSLVVPTVPPIEYIQPASPALPAPPVAIETVPIVTPKAAVPTEPSTVSSTQRPMPVPQVPPYGEQYTPPYPSSGTPSLSTSGIQSDILPALPHTDVPKTSEFTDSPSTTSPMPTVLPK